MAMVTADPQDVPKVESFAFTAENLARAKGLMAQYPAGRQASAVIGLLYIAQEQAGGWLPRAAMDHVASLLEMAPIRVYEVASFYTMFNLRPVGRHHLQVCTTTPCWLRGSDEVLRTCKEVAGCDVGEVSADGAFSIVEVECLGACVNAPMLQINNAEFYEDLDAASTRALLEALRRGESPKEGTQVARQTSAPIGGPTTLKSQPAKG
ncbi:MAG: NADH-quinone oxidoreductase subunit NuoE [Reyranellaceae bacterium]